MILAVVFLLAASLLASGILFRHERILTYVATAGVLFEGQWLLLTLLDRTLIRAVDSAPVFVTGAAALMLIWAVFYKAWHRPVFKYSYEISVLIVLLPVLVAAWLIAGANGFNEAGHWVTHGFYNGDTATLITLTQRSQLTDGLVETNPFAGGGELEYPTLLHAGLATFLVAFGFNMDWLELLPTLTFMQILLTVPMFFLLWDVFIQPPKLSWHKLLGVPKRGWVLAGQAAIVFYVLTLAWDNYVYPQSHFFLTGLFLLLIGLYQRGEGEKLWREFLWVVPGAAVALVLMLSNAVTGTAAVAATIVFYGLRALDKGRPTWQRVSYLLGIGAWLALFIGLTPGDGAFTWPQFAYAAVPTMLRLAPIVLALAAAILLVPERNRFLEISAAALMALAVFTFYFSGRNIVIDNAERFFYHALLLGFPVLLAPGVQLFYFLQRRLLYTTLHLGQKLTAGAVVAASGIIFILPGLASVASAHDHLMFKDEQVVQQVEIEAVRWLREKADIGAIVLARPQSPFAVPMFSGRALLRSDYWLSSGDSLEMEVRKSFDGDRAAQATTSQAADFVLLRADEIEDWDLTEYEPIFTNEATHIYRGAYN